MSATAARPHDPARPEDPASSAAAHRRDRKRLAALLLGFTVVAFAVGAAFHLVFRDSLGGGNVIGGPFQLTDGAGRPVTDKSWPGRYLLVYFGYTNCPDACPTTLAAIGAAMDQLGRRAARIQPLFISIDPHRDRPPVMKSYVAAFSPRLVGLTGTDAQVAHVAREYGAFFSDFEEMRADDYSVDHSHYVYLMAPDGRFLTEIASTANPTEIAAEIGHQIPRT